MSLNLFAYEKLVINVIFGVRKCVHVVQCLVVESGRQLWGVAWAVVVAVESEGVLWRTPCIYTRARFVSVCLNKLSNLLGQTTDPCFLLLSDSDETVDSTRFLTIRSHPRGAVSTSKYGISGAFSISRNAEQ